MQTVTPGSKCAKVIHVRTGLFLFLLLLYGPAIPVFAQNESESEVVGAQKEAEDRPIEEITVEGRRVRPGIALQRAQKDFFDLFNRLNDDKDYDVHCRMETSAGTRIKHWTCVTRYFDEEIATATQLGMQGISYNPMYVIQKKNQIMIEKTAKLLEEHPELQVLAERISDRAEEYQERYFSKD